MSTRSKRLLRVVLAAPVVLAILACAGLMVPGFIPALELLFVLAAGWAWFLGRVVPKLDVRWDLVASAAVYAGLFVVGSHLFLRWLHREVRRATRPADQPPGGAWRWRWRWTLGGAAVVLLMFAAGTAVVGIAHQAAWLARSPEPVFRRGVGASGRTKCYYNLKSLGMGLQAYARAHDGKLPDNFRQLVADPELYLSVRELVCPASNDEPAPGATPAEQAAHLLTPGHCSYIYFGKGLTADAPPATVIAVELLDHHKDGMNVLYADGRVEWTPRPEAEPLLERLGFERVEPEKSGAATRP